MRYDELQDEIKNAMRAKDKPKLSILRQVHGEIKNIEVNERRDITDADVDAMLKRLIKQTKETLDGSIKAGNDQERTDTLTAQVAILESYLPKQVSGDELAALIDEVLTETGASSKKDMGRVMGALTQKTGGNFDKALGQTRASLPTPASTKTARMMRAFFRCDDCRAPCDTGHGGNREAESILYRPKR